MLKTVLSKGAVILIAAMLVVAFAVTSANALLFPFGLFPFGMGSGTGWGGCWGDGGLGFGLGIGSGIYNLGYLLGYGTGQGIAAGLANSGLGAILTKMAPGAPV